MQAAGTGDNKGYNFAGAGVAPYPQPVNPPPPAGYSRRPPPAGDPSGGGTGVNVGRKGGLVALFVNIILRAVAIVTTFIATIVMAVNSEKVWKAMKFSPLKYFVAVNAIAFFYALVSLGLSIMSLLLSFSSPSIKRILMLVMAILDVVMVAFLFSSVGSASSLGVYFDEKRYCERSGTFCPSLGGSIFVSAVGSVAFLVLTVFSIVSLHMRRSASST